MSTDTDTPGGGVPHVHRIGILLSRTKRLQIPALRYLILHLNCLQNVFEYELLPNDAETTAATAPLAALNVDEEIEDRLNLRDVGVPEFVRVYLPFLREESNRYRLKQSPPENLIFISLATFKDGYYSTRPNFDRTHPAKMSVLALGNWENGMAPPSLLEFILTLVLRESVAFVAPSLRTSIHLGTKGCICDFTSTLEDAKYKALQGFVCEYCSYSLAQDGFPELAEFLTTILRKDWLGRRSDPSSVAAILGKLDYDLFVTKGLKPSASERWLKLLREEGTKQALELLGKLALAAAIVYLSAHGIKLMQE